MHNKNFPNVDMSIKRTLWGRGLIRPPTPLPAAVSGGAAQAALAAEMAECSRLRAVRVAAERALLEPFVAARVLRRAGWEAPRIDLALGVLASGEAVAGEGHQVLRSAGFFSSWGDDEVSEAEAGWHDDGVSCLWRELGACVRVEDDACVVIEHTAQQMSLFAPTLADGGASLRGLPSVGEERPMRRGRGGGRGGGGASGEAVPPVSRTGRARAVRGGAGGSSAGRRRRRAGEGSGGSGGGDDSGDGSDYELDLLAGAL